MTAKFSPSTWQNIIELAGNGDEIHKIYAEMLATSIGLCITRGLTQADIARRSGLSHSIVSKIEQQNIALTVKNFLRYIYDLELEWGFYQKNGMKNKIKNKVFCYLSFL